MRLPTAEFVLKDIKKATPYWMPVSVAIKYTNDAYSSGYNIEQKPCKKRNDSYAKFASQGIQWYWRQNSASHARYRNNETRSIGESLLALS